jgi:hypothetical protein
MVHKIDNNDQPAWTKNIRKIKQVHLCYNEKLKIPPACILYIRIINFLI